MGSNSSHSKSMMRWNFIEAFYNLATILFRSFSEDIHIFTDRSLSRFQVRKSGGHLIRCAVVLAEQYVILGKAVMRIDCAAK